MKFLIFLENDVSLDTGDGINERESLQALLDICGDDLLIVLPEPACPNNFYDPRVHYVPSHRTYQPLRYLWFLWASWRAIRTLVREHDVAAIIHRPGATLLLPFLLSLGKIPIILKTLAAFNHMKKNEGTLLKRLTVWAYERIAPYFFSRCSGGDTVSKLYVDWFSENYGLRRESLLAVFNGVNINTFRQLDTEESRKFLGVTQFEFVAGYIGAIHPMRELEVAIESLAYLPEYPGLGIVLVGDGPDRVRLEELAKSLGVADRVVFKSALPYSAMPQVINAFDVGIDLTKVEVESAQGVQTASFSQKISQYLSCGIPVIAWDTIDTRFLADHQLGKVLQRSTARDVAGALQELIETRQENQVRICHYAKTHLSAERVARTRLALWQRLVTPASPADKNDHVDREELPESTAA